MMRITMNKEECGGFVRYLPVKKIDPEARREAERIFNEYRSRGTIINSEFLDDWWLMYDELHSITIDFRFDDLIFTRNARPWMGCTSECYFECAHAFLAFQLGRCGFSYLRVLAKDMTKLGGMTMEEAIDAFGEESAQMAEFLSLIPESNDLRDQVIETLEERRWESRNKGPRQLPEFKYYLRFSRALDLWWKEADPQRKKLYFPVYFWWHLTAILPLRATEFLTTPRDCLSENGDSFFLTIRRTRMKKKGRTVYYRLDEDYEKRKYEIPEWLYSEISLYKDMTKGEELPALGTLLVPERPVPSGYFTYVQMTRRLKNFCAEALGEADFPIHVGDTRHLAMINLILSGGSPTICKELAGHESIDISSNYYANLSSVVESVIYEKYHGDSGDVYIGGSLRFPLSLPEKRTRVNNGWCDSPGIRSGDISECMKAYGNGGMIGECSRCVHYCSDDPGLTLSIEKDYKKKVDEDARYLVQMIELVRKGLGYPEDIGSALLRLQGSSYRYGAALTKKMNGTEVSQNGKTKKD